jgi:hypothetical protein
MPSQPCSAAWMRASPSAESKLVPYAAMMPTSIA